MIERNKGVLIAPNTSLVQLDVCSILKRVKNYEN